MFKNKKQIATTLSLTATLILTGCQPNPPATRIDPQGTRLITTVGEFDIQDATDAATTLSESLLKKGILGKKGKASIIAISNYVNNTNQQLDRDTILKKIRITLNNAGVAKTIVTIGDHGNKANAQDNLAAKRAKGDQLAIPDYSITLKIMSQPTRAGKVRQKTYTIQMTLTDLNTGLAEWEDEVQIVKQGRHNNIGL